MSPELTQKVLRALAGVALLGINDVNMSIKLEDCMKLVIHMQSIIYRYEFDVAVVRGSFHVFHVLYLLCISVVLVTIHCTLLYSYIYSHTRHSK